MTQRNYMLLCIAAAFMIMSAASMGYIQYLTPYQLDDLDYGAPFHDTMLRGGSGISLKENLDFIKAHYLMTNGRLGDKFIMSALTNTPKWLMALFCSLSCFSLTFFGSRIAFGSIRKHPIRSIILTGIITLLMPWGDKIFVTNMLLNYGMPVGLSAPVIWLLLRQQGMHSRAYYIGVGVLAFITAAWHEAYSVPMLAGLTAMIAVYGKKNITRTQYVIFFATLAGVVFILSAPGFWYRLNHVDRSQLETSPMGYFLDFLKGGNICFLLPIIYLLFRWKKQWGERLGERMMKLLLISSAMIVMCLIIFLVSVAAKRVFWFVDYPMLLIYTAIAAVLLRKSGRIFRMLAGIAAMLFTCLHFAATIPHYSLISREYKEMLLLYEKTDKDYIFYDFHGKGFGPALSLWRARCFGMEFSYRGYFNVFFNRNERPVASVVPTFMREFKKEDFPVNPKIISRYGYFITNDTTLQSKSIIFADCETKFGVTTCVPTLTNKFITRDGTTLYYLEPDMRYVTGSQITAVKY